MKLIKKIIDKLTNPDVSYEERTMVMLAILGSGSMVVALIFDVLIRESLVEIFTLVAMILAVVIVTGVSVHFHKVMMGLVIQSSALIFVILPVIFLFGGGARGGGVFWIIFSYMFIGMSLHGKLRVFMMIYLTALSVFEYLIWFFKPEWISFYEHTDEMFAIDALVSALLVGLATFTMLMYQKYIFRTENERAQKETERAEELNRSQNQFFSSMSHEIRTPINSILGLNELILRQEDASEEIRRDALNIQGSGRMLLTLVNDILDVSKIKAGKMDIVPVNYDLGVMISEIVNMIWIRAEEKGLKFNVDVDPNIPAELFGDEVRIKQILINLLNNAVKYTKEGSVTLHIEHEEMTQERVQIVFSVTDTGMGIKQDALPYLFDAFQRMDEGKNRYIEGTGLGLSIVKQLVDLMDGRIAVNSVYEQGSTFTVSLWQGITNFKEIGDLNITSFGISENITHYEAGFTAPGTRILIVDDNEMNLAVEKKLIADTLIDIDTVLSGKEALENTLKHKYDVILMDHLMPEMDGIECFEKIRRQTGGLNNNTAVIVLTANAGSENRELYNRVGFDGYLVKPVSGQQLEELLLNTLPPERIRRNTNSSSSLVEMNTARGYSRKIPVLITTGSICDLPVELIKELQLDYIPFTIRSENGTFWDNVEAGADELLRFMDENRGELDSQPPTVEEFEQFFAKMLKKAHRVIYLSMTTSMSEDYDRAHEAARNFENVTVVNSGAISSSIGILTMIAYRLAMQNEPADQIISELERVKNAIHCNFIISETKYMTRRKYISSKIHMLMSTLNMRLSLSIRNNSFGVGHIYIGSVRSCYEKYIHRALPRHAEPDLDLLFVTYVGLGEEDLEFIGNEIKKRFDFKHVIFQKASAAVSLNCGPGTFGLLYMDKIDKEYHLSSMLPHTNDQDDERRDRSGIYDEKMPENEQTDSMPSPAGGADAAMVRANAGNNGNDVSAQNAAEGINEETQGSGTHDSADVPQLNWYDDLEGIDGKTAIKNSGSEEAFLTVLRIFYDMIPEKSAEINKYYDQEDWADYTIKVHALKSSAKLIGALGLSEDAQALEDAGKAEDIEYIRENHRLMMQEYLKYNDILSPVFNTKREESAKPVADRAIMDSVYEALKEAAQTMNCDMIDDALSEISEYAIPDEDEELFGSLKACADMYDYDGILKIMSENNI